MDEEDIELEIEDDPHRASRPGTALARIRAVSLALGDAARRRRVSIAVATPALGAVSKTAAARGSCAPCCSEASLSSLPSPTLAAAIVLFRLCRRPVCRGGRFHRLDGRNAAARRCRVDHRHAGVGGHSRYADRRQLCQQSRGGRKARKRHWGARALLSSRGGRDGAIRCPQVHRTISEVLAFHGQRFDPHASRTSWS